MTWCHELSKAEIIKFLFLGRVAFKVVGYGAKIPSGWKWATRRDVRDSLAIVNAVMRTQPSLYVCALADGGSVSASYHHYQFRQVDGGPFQHELLASVCGK